VNTIRIIIADDHTLLRDGLRALFASISDIEVVGEAETGAEVIAKAAQLQPDVILMDIQMPDVNGIQATRQIVAKYPSIGIIVVTMYKDDDSVFAAMRAGARGYILKGADQDEMLPAIRAVASGEALFGPEITTRLVNFFSSSQADLSPQAFPELTSHEHEMLELIARGLNNQAIANRLSISKKTVRNPILNIFNKLQVVDRA
jgi:DNA-binding NarL/FixJ family response regulator